MAEKDKKKYEEDEEDKKYDNDRQRLEKWRRGRRNFP